MGPGIFHTTVPNQGPVNLGHFEPRSFGFLNDPMNLRNQQPNQPILFSTGNQIPALQPQINYGFQPNGQYFQSPAGFNGNQPIWNQSPNIGTQPMALQKALMDKSALWKFKNSVTQDIGDWIFTMERHFRRMQEIYANITDRHKVDCAVDYLRDSAFSVYKDLENSNVSTLGKIKKSAFSHKKRFSHSIKKDWPRKN